MRCKRNLRKCRACGWETKNARPSVCPECGGDMRCDKSAVLGYALCSAHGGPVPARGFYGTGTMTTGSGSSFKLTRLAARYNDIQKNGSLLSNRAAVDIIDQRIVQLAGRIDENDMPERVKALYTLWKEFTEALNSGRDIESTIALKKMEDAFEKVYHDYMAWQQMFEALDYRRKMVEGEVKILKEIKAIITIEDARDLQIKLLAAVMRVLQDDPRKLKQVQYEFARITGDISDAVAAFDADNDEGGDGTGGGEAGPGNVDQAEFLHSGDEGRPDP